MTSCVWHSLRLWVAVCALVGFTRSAQAETSAASLGVRSQDGEDELERRLGTALRNAAKSIGEFSVSDRELSLEQMLLAQGCDEPDAKCLQQIAATLSVERLFYGSVVDHGGAYELTLYMFDGGAKNITSMAAHGIAPELFTAANASDTVEKVLRRLLGKDLPAAPVAVATTGTLRIEGGVPGTEILIDGKPGGTIDDQGLLVLTLPEGKHTVRPAGAEYRQLDEQLALIEVGRVDAVRLAVVQVASVLDDEPPPALEPASQPGHSSTRLRRTLGYVSIGVGVAMAIATIYSWVRIGNINDDGSYKAYRAAFPRTGTDGGVKNVCVPASRGELAASQGAQLAALERKADKLCNEADRLETLQYVFLGGTVLFGGVGTYLVLSARDKPSQPAATLRIDPRFSAQSAGLAATLSF